MTSEMPHSVTPESTPAEESSAAVSQADAVKSEPETQDVAMEDAPIAAAAEKTKVNLEELFDDEDSDEEFPSSAPAPTSQEDASQPAPMYAPHLPTCHVHDTR
jgi:DNA primase small subunit